MDTFTVETTARTELVDITRQVRKSLQRTSMRQGFGVIYLSYTTAGLTINDHKDPDVAHDLLLALERAVPRDQEGFRHKDGDSDAHVKATLVGASVLVMVEDGELSLGNWRGVFLCELDGPRKRTVKLTWMSLPGGTPQDFHLNAKRKPEQPSALVRCLGQ